jgi:hypothetical protein
LLSPLLSYGRLMRDPQAEPMRSIPLQFACFDVYPDFVRTVFTSGGAVDGAPHPEMPHYHVIAHRCGYGDDLMAYCLEHEFCHSFLSEQLHGRPSRVMFALAHGRPIAPGRAAEEEMATQMFQRWLRAHERPIVGGIDWDRLKQEALTLLEPKP